MPTFKQHGRDVSRATTISIIRPSVDSTAHSVDTAATHYKDPDARKKLRQYLASPQKFDEAVEFGFPSQTPSPPMVESDMLKASRSTSSNDAQNFLKQDKITFIDRYDEAESDDTGSDEGLESPVTPGSIDDIFRESKLYGSSIFAGIDSTEIPALNFNFDHDIVPLAEFPLDPLANREMTLRMTLTRADLRANEDELYGWTRKEDDPLALEELHVTDDTTGAYGAFAVKPNNINNSNNNNRRSGMFKKILDRVKNDRRH
jgi:hypothetical protein